MVCLLSDPASCASIPGNLRHGDDWQGLSAIQTDTAFCQFDSPLYGLRALMRVLLNYRRIVTIRQAISRWAPPSENDTAAYVNTVARRLGVDPDAPLDWGYAETLTGMARAIVTHENGRAPQGFPADWYSPEHYYRAAMMALGLTEV
ncbi:structural protein [Azospirillum argentinense]